VPFSRVDARELAVRLPAVLSRAGVSLLEAQVEDLSPLAGGAWRLRIRRTADPADRQEIGAVQVVLAAGPHCRALWPSLPSRLRASWAGVLLLPGNPGGSVWLERVHRGWVVQPARWKRPDLERTVDDHPGERWIVDAGLAPWGEGVLLGQITLVQPGPGPPPPPDPVLMEQRLRAGLELLDPRLATCNAAYHQVQVPFSPDGQPLVGPVGGVDNLWIFSGFSGAFAAVPPQAERLARALLPQRADARAPVRGGGTA
jgi:glycine/D-amino acid oxidase-like deaminating enzyme